MANRRLRCVCAAGLLLAGTFAARAEPATSIVVATGQYGMRKEVPHAIGFDLQIRTPWRWTVFRPIAGALTSSGGGTFLYTGVMADFDLPLGLRLSPGFAPSIALARATGDLGFPVEFRSSLELSIAAGDRLRVGVGFSHISNARLGDRNPGVELLMLVLAFPKD